MFKTKIKINGKMISLGTYHSEEQASKAYQLALNNIDRYQDNKQFRELVQLLLIESIVLN
jgi:hypothetical protein